MTNGPLDGIRVLDAGILFGGPLAATLLGDFGADVIKIEHPRGDSLRAFGWQENGESVWWKVVGRNKRSIVLDLSTDDGGDVFAALAACSDVVIEGFRPGTLEGWGLGYERLSESNPGLVLLRVSGYGQTGPYRDRPGFGTLAEAMSGFAAITGQPDGPPTLPSTALADGIAALAGAFAVASALAQRAANDGRGQIIDLSLFEPLFWLLGPQVTVYQRLGVVMSRPGNRTEFSAPRNLYRTADFKWIALSGSNDNTAFRVLRLVGGDELAADPRFRDNASRLAHVDEIDELIASWVGQRTREDALRLFAEEKATAGPVYDAADITNDPQFHAREAIVDVDGYLMQGLIAQLSSTPGSIRRPAPAKGEHTAEVLRECGIDENLLSRIMRQNEMASDRSEQPVNAGASPGST